MSGPTDLEYALCAMFRVYFSKQGENGKLSKQAFLELLSEQMPSFTKHCDVGEEIFQGIDLNKDGCVDFKEFALMVAGYACGQHELLLEMSEKPIK